MSLADATRVIGYVASNTHYQMLCDDDACIVAGSESAMHHYLVTYAEPAAFTVKKTRFGELLSGLAQGGRYAFDEIAYNRFYPLANRYDFALSEEDFSIPPARDQHFHFIIIG